MMLDVLQKAIAFVFVLGVLIAFHEFGHFWVARKLGVKVLRFSVGFGKPLLRYQASPDTPEYVLAALPLGGYVKMLDEREGEVPASEQHLAFNNQNVWKRIAIVAAGPLFNLALAVIFFACVYMAGIPSIKPVIAQPAEQTLAAQVGFSEGDVITSINGIPVNTWSELRLNFIAEAVDGGVLELGALTSEGMEKVLELDLSDQGVLKEEGDALKRLGFSLWEPVLPAVLGDLSQDMPAIEAGLKRGDEVLELDGVAVKDWAHLVKLIQARPGDLVEISYLPKDQSDSETIEIKLARIETKEGKAIGRLGAGPWIDGDPYENYRTTAQYGFVGAVVEGAKKTWNMSVLTVKVIGQLITGDASIKNISGPLSIAQYAGETAQIGLIFLIDFMAVISVSLGVLNLLPVPILDGGHLLFYMVEVVKGSPVSERAMLVGQQLGIVLLGLMMVVAFYNDITRIFG